MASLPLLVPLHRVPLTAFTSEWLAAFLGVLAMVAAFAFRNAGPIRTPQIAAAPALLIAVVLAQLAARLYPYATNAAVVVLYLAWSALLAIAGRTLAHDRGEDAVAVILAHCVLAGGIVNAVCGFLQYLQWWPAFNGWVAEPMAVAAFGVYGNLAQQNHFATHVALAMASACYLFAIRRLRPSSFTIVCVALLAALVLSGSRSGFLYVAWIGVLFLRLPHADAEPGHGRRTGLRIFGIAAALVIAAVPIAFAMKLPLAGRLSAMADAFGPRFYLWRHAMAMFAAHPLLGAGFDGFAWNLVEQIHRSGAPTAWGIDQYAHNLGLQLLAVSGIAGFAAVAIPVVLFVRTQWTAQRDAVRMWLWSVLGVLAIHSMLEQPLHYAYFLGIAAFVAGVADRREKETPAASANVIMALLVVAFVFLIKTASDYDKLDGYFYSGRYPQTAQARHVAAVDLRDKSVFAPLIELASPGDFVPASGPAQDKLALNARIMHFAPTAEVEFRHAALLAEAGRNADAVTQFDRAALAYPHEVGQYVDRFNALAAGNAAVYGALAAHAAEVAGKVGIPK
jgi:O-antigen ligase